MTTVRFNTTIGNDHVIRPPAGVNITPGAAEVIVVQNDSVAAAPANKGLGFRERLASAAEELGIRDLPPDLAENHNHYARGTFLHESQFVPKSIRR